MDTHGATGDSTTTSRGADLPREAEPFTLGELRRALAVGFEASERLRALACFSRRDPRCLGCLETLASEPRSSPGVETSAAAVDPVALALRRWIGVLRAAPGWQRAVDQLRPAHTYWVHRSLRLPLGFCRLTIEESRDQILRHPAQARQISRSIVDDLEDPRLFAELAPYGEEELRGLRALALAYHAEDCRAARDHLRADELFLRVERHLDHGVHDDEIRATVFELRFQLAHVRREYTRALHLLDSAEKLLRRAPRPIPGRLAEILVRRGSVFLQTEAYTQAIQALEEAVEEIPARCHPWLRRTALLRLATAELFHQDPSAALRHLRAAEELQVPHPIPVNRAQEFWLRGSLHLSMSRNAEAEAPLREALERFRQLGFVSDAVDALSSLGRLYLIEGRKQDFDALANECAQLLLSSELRRRTLRQLQELLLLAREQGRELPALEARLTELERRLQTRIH